ncbi:MAG: diguanylate cyclase [Woeseiaceae bacterium]|nr:diguanylate cyclase [Woeseiaceae bacterium]
MTGRILPRYLIVGVALAALVSSILLSIFYGQYRVLASGLVATGVEHHRIGMVASFEQRARSRLGRIADSVSWVDGEVDMAATRELVEHAVAGPDEFVGLRLATMDGQSINAGTVPSAEGDNALDVHDGFMALRQPVMRNGSEVAILIGNFDLSSLNRETADFRERMLAAELDYRSASLTWISLSMLVLLLLCAVVVWMIIRAQNARIHAIIVEAQKLSDANFGEPLKGPRGDELGDLVDVFNTMREKLRRTTISRNYVDSILGGMNEAIIVTSSDGIITRVNDATARMLDYDEEELVGKPLDLIIDQKHGGDLKTDTRSGIPMDATLVTRHGEPVPVSYTGSRIGDDEASGDFIFAAQNTTERRKAEQRIRYLARIDALTKVPNRMQFQHLLQRAIARAKRSRRTLCLFYIDVDHFKEINDTFGHLAGDTTLETVAERLSSALPEDTVIGRLAGDEFAVIVDQIETNSLTIPKLDELARKLLDRLADPFYVQGHEVFMTASMGIACYPDDAPNVIDLIRNADAALYHAKKGGGNVFAYYSPR